MTTQHITKGEQMTGNWRVVNDSYDIAPVNTYTVADLDALAAQWAERFEYEPGNGRVVDESGAVVAVRA